jgi:hypothetical protein
MNPWPSYCNSLMAVARRLLNINRQPENGSVDSFSRHNSASPSIPFLRIDGFDRHQNAHLWADLQHRLSAHERADQLD